VRTRDGQRIALSASCGNLPEVELAVSQHMAAIGLYRTELLYLVDKEPPSPETLTQHYAAVMSAAGKAPVTLRLLHVDSSLGLAYLHPARELNPALGRAGVRALLSREQVLRTQLQAILRAAEGTTARVLVPFVTDTAELRRVKECAFEERLALKKSKTPHGGRLRIGVAIETPAAVLGIRDLAREADFVVVALDSLIQHLLAADRENAEVRDYFESLHPFVVRAVHQVVDACDDLDRPLSVFGVTAVQTHNLPFLLGCGVREVCVAPESARSVAEEIEKIDSHAAARAAQTAAASSCQAETLSLVDGYRHGFARP
jgi:phosphoenolpyruvate-protein kinase (PTS system EI component)